MKFINYLSLILCFFLVRTSNAQQAISPLQLVTEKKAAQASFSPTTLFRTAPAKSIEAFKNSTHQFLAIDPTTLDQLRVQQPEQFTLVLPWEEDILAIELVKVNLLAPDFQLVESATNKAVELDLGVHYQGIIKNDKTSIAAFSINDTEIMGLFSAHNKGNLVLGPLQAGNATQAEYILYEDSDIMQKFDLDCATPDDGISYTREQLEFRPSNSRATGDCIRLYYEVDNDITNDKGGTAGATNFTVGMHNQVAAIYGNEQINTVISEIFVWTTPSPYNSSSSGGMLSAFQNFRTNWNGDLAQLISYKASGGIAAGFNGICNTNRTASMSFSSINTGFNIYPNYSWTVMVVTHEFGHTFGSRHTHACVWNGNGTAIDGCSGSTEGSCPLPGNPPQGGTIMSYCHFNVGINFNEGFGPQPGNVIRNIVANANCTVACGPPSCEDGIQNGDETGIDCGGPDCPACPTCDDGIQNGDELGIDCGGPDCPTCPCSNNLTLTIGLDQYPTETTWQIVDADNNTWAAGGPYNSTNNTITESICIPDGCYTFVMNDSYGDGICCTQGNGFYILTNNNGGSVLASGGQFTSVETTPFCVEDTQAPTCNDGIQNGDEEGIDCGGPNCPPCFTCDDGIQNGDEEGVDCGGATCPPCEAACVTHNLTINFDFAPSQTSWTIIDNAGNIVANSDSYDSDLESETLVETICLEEGCYTFSFNDSSGNGICCRFGRGSFIFTNDAGVEIASGSNFGDSVVANFCVGDDGNEPTCTDGIQNGDEEGVDCGGSNCPPCEVVTCDDGIQNGDEEGIDCGGSDCPPCEVATCDDGIQNGDEEGVDCGGSDCPPCEVVTCDDGIQNGDEEGVDCGGSDCPPCEIVTCDDGIQNGDEEGVDCGGSDCPACPTCDDGMQNGDEEGVDCGGSDCPACPTCSDGIQNGDEIGIDCGGSCPPCDATACDNPTIVDQATFENGLGSWNDGGSDCRRSIGDAPYANSGSYCIRLRDDSNSSRLTSDQLDLINYDELVVEFTYFPRSMENGESFFLQLSNNNSFSFISIQEWVAGVDFANNLREFVSVTIPGPFSANTRIRFQNNGSNNSDYIYLDDISITGCTDNASLSFSATNQKSSTPAELKQELSAISIYPNPTRGLLNVQFNTIGINDIQLIVTDLTGKLLQRQEIRVADGQQNLSLRNQGLDAGIYFLHIITENGRQVKKFAVVR